MVLPTRKRTCPDVWDPRENVVAWLATQSTARTSRFPANANGHTSVARVLPNPLVNPTKKPKTPEKQTQLANGKRCKCHQLKSKASLHQHTFQNPTDTCFMCTPQSNRYESVAHYLLCSHRKLTSGQKHQQSCSQNISKNLLLDGSGDSLRGMSCTSPTSDYESGVSSSKNSSVSCSRSSSDLSSVLSRVNCVDLDSGLSEEESSLNDSGHKTSQYKKHVLICKRITVIIPDTNQSGCSREAFTLKVIEHPLYVPKTNLRTLHAAEVVSIEPHGISFFKSSPAIIILPLWYPVEKDDEIVCLYSNTPEGIIPQWEPLSKDCYSYQSGLVTVHASHFSLFTVLLVKPCPETRRRIGRHGSILRVPEVPGLEVQFPAGVLQGTVEACVKVPYEDDTQDMALASPVVMVGPHGLQFNPGNGPVIIKIPVPDYEEIVETFGSRAKLSLWQSATSEDEPLHWEQVNVDLYVEHNRSLGVTTVSFPVYHFSFFKVLWDILSGSLYEAKLGVAFFYPYISFSMMCQAWMEENRDTSRFGLEVICYRSDKKLPEATNYKHRVGSSLKPKLVRPGKIVIRLKSEMFCADVEAGEDPSLAKEEHDFRGREFDKQFACKFKQTAMVDRGTFGKVIVERLNRLGSSEPLFEFNLHKSGHENEPVPEISDRWSIVAMKELAGTLQIIDDNNWKKFARHIGFTKNEILTKLQYSPDPFLAMVNLYQNRGGTPEEFVQALYEVSNEIQKEVAEKRLSSSPSGSTSSSASSWKRKPWLSSFWRGNNNIGDSDTETSGTSTTSRKRLNTDKTPGRVNSKRRRFSEVSETMSSSEESASAEICRKDNRVLVEHDLWKISSLINNNKWCALGRVLGLDESVLTDVEKTHKEKGIRECAYQMLLEWKGRRPKQCTFGKLYSILVKENMTSVAKQMEVMKLGD